MPSSLIDRPSVGSPSSISPLVLSLRRNHALVAVVNQASLLTALTGVAGEYGGVITLDETGGRYRISADNLRPRLPLIIRSRNPAHPATIEFFGKTNGPIVRAKNIILRDVIFDRREISYATSGQGNCPINLLDAENILIDNCRGIGRAVDRYPGNTNPTGIALGEDMGRFTDCKNIMVRGSQFEGFAFGFQCLGVNEGITFEGNLMERGQRDYLHFGGSNSRVTVRGNRLRNLLGSINEYRADTGNHDDFIQFHTNAATVPSTDILIEDNDFDSAGGLDSPQGIFFGNEAIDQQGKTEDAMSYRRVTIRGNRVRIGQLNGIKVSYVKDLLVEKNLVLWDPGFVNTDADLAPAVGKPNINTKGAACTGIVRDNICGQYIVTGMVAQSGNFVLDYDNAYGTDNPARIIPGSTTLPLAAFASSDRLPVGFVPGPDRLKIDAAYQFAAVRAVAADYPALAGDLAADPQFAAPAKWVRLKMTITHGDAIETTTANYWGFGPVDGIVGPRKVLMDILVRDGAAGEFVFAAYSAEPLVGPDLQSATNRVALSARHRGAGHHVYVLDVPSGQTWWPAVAGAGSLPSAFVFEENHLWPLTTPLPANGITHDDDKVITDDNGVPRSGD